MGDIYYFLILTAPCVIPAMGGTALILLSASGCFKRVQASAAFWVFVFVSSLSIGASAVLLLRGVGIDVAATQEWFSLFQKHFLADGFSYGWLVSANVFVLLAGIFARADFGENESFVEILSLILFAGSGLSFLITAASLLMVFLGLEFLSLPVYVLVACKKQNANCCEAGLKYFLFGSLASVLLLLGIAFIYASTGTLYFVEIEKVLRAPGFSSILVGLALFIGAVGFKIGIAPFHMWLPDVYEGAPFSITAFMGSAIKVAAFGMALRLFWGPFLSQARYWSPVLEWLAVGAMIVGSVGGLAQKNLKRLLAYSSIAHAGYLLLGVAVVPRGLDSAVIWFYITTYGVMFVGLLGVVGLLERNLGGHDFKVLEGLGLVCPFFGVVTSLLVLSAAGMPPLAGFMAKYFLFSDIVRSGHVASVVIAVMSSAVSIYYYLRILVLLYMKEPPPAVKWPRSTGLVYATVIACVIVLCYLGVSPDVLGRTVR